MKGYSWRKRYSRIYSIEKTKRIYLDKLITGSSLVRFNNGDIMDYRLQNLDFVVETNVLEKDTSEGSEMSDITSDIAEASTSMVMTNDVLSIERHRILHYLSCVRYDNYGMFLSGADSNFSVVIKTINFLPFCHHYILIPEKNDIKENIPFLLQCPNVTLLSYRYSVGGRSTRLIFDKVLFKHTLNFRKTDIDYIFCHRPEVAGDIRACINDETNLSSDVKIVSFFHWIDCNCSRTSGGLRMFYRQLEALEFSDAIFLHSKEVLSHFYEHFKPSKTAAKVPIFGHSNDKIDERIYEMPLSSDIVKIQETSINEKFQP